MKNQCFFSHFYSYGKTKFLPWATYPWATKVSEDFFRNGKRYWLPISNISGGEGVYSLTYTQTTYLCIERSFSPLICSQKYILKVSQYILKEDLPRVRIKWFFAHIAEFFVCNSRRNYKAINALIPKHSHNVKQVYKRVYVLVYEVKSLQLHVSSPSPESNSMPLCLFLRNVHVLYKAA